MAAQAPTGATLVVFHTWVLFYVSPPRRDVFVDLVRGLPGRWISNEGPDTLPYNSVLPEPSGDVLHNVLALDGTPLAWTRAHAQAMVWFANSLA